MKRLMNGRIFLFLSSLLLSFSAFAALNPTETKIRQEVVQSKTAQLKLLKKLVNINSGTMNTTGVKRVGDILQKEFRQMGFNTRWVYEPSSMHRAPTLIAERHGKGGKRLLLIGHLDTVFAKNSPFQHFELRKNSAKGPGVLDNKGGDLVILYALKALYKSHALDNTSITVVLTGDEEDSGKPTTISRKPLVAAAKQSDVALDFESAITLDTATIARRGISLWTIETQGNESHSATIFQPGVGEGAIFEMSRILFAMRSQLKDEKYLSFNPGLVLGGTSVKFNPKTSQGTAFGKENVVAKIALAKGDFRFIDEKQKLDVENKIRDIVKEHLAGTKATVTYQDGIPAMSPTENNLKLLEKYSEVSVDLGQGVIKPLDPGLRGAGDISHISAYVPANLAGLGPEGLGSHSVIESVELPSLTIQTERAAILIYRLTHQN